jgi:hypothetical protein
MTVKKTYTVPSTNSRLAQSVDFSGYIYPQMVTTMMGFNTIGAVGTVAGVANYINEKATSKNVLTNLLLANQNMSAIAGIKSFTKTYNKEVFKRKQLGNYEYIQCLPGTIGISLSLEKVVSYKNTTNKFNTLSQLNSIDDILDTNYDGLIKQTAPLMIVENLQSPDGTIKTIMYMDCWVKSSKISYNLNGDVAVINSIGVECASVFLPSDVASDIITTATNQIGDLISNKLNWQFNTINPLD